jgi:hypothetical protein
METLLSAVAQTLRQQTLVLPTIFGWTFFYLSPIFINLGFELL